MCGVHINRTRSRGLRAKKYPRLHCGPCRGKYVHTLIAEAMLGRELHDYECVDHRDGNGLNAKPWNLRVVTIIGNSRKNTPPLKGEVIFDGAEWWKKNNPGWIDPFTSSGQEDINGLCGPSTLRSECAPCPDKFCVVGINTESRGEPRPTSEA